jgi:hypothetical protein
MCNMNSTIKIWNIILYFYNFRMITYTVYQINASHVSLQEYTDF